MRKLTFGLFAAALGLSLATAAFGLEVPLTYQRHPDDTETFRPGGSATLGKSLDRPAGTWKLPELNSKQPIYAFAELGEKKRLLVLDRQNADDFFYSRLYFDSNGNGDLTDDTVVNGTFTVENDEFCRAQFPAIDTTVDLDGESHSYSFRTDVFYFYFGDEGKPDTELRQEHIQQNLNLVVVANCSYVGEFELDGQRYRVALGDANVNGRFNDRFSVRQAAGSMGGCSPVIFQGDHFLLGSNEKLDVYATQPCGDKLLVNATLFDMNINTNESRLVLKPVTENLVALRLAMATDRITLYTEDGSCCVMMYRPGTEVIVPRGSYRFLNYTVRRKDEQGDEWLLAAQATTESPSVTVDGRGDALLKFGEPYVPTVGVPEWSRQAVIEGLTQIPLMFIVTGQGKEVLAELTRISGTRTRIPLSEENRNRPKEPTYIIARADGEIVTQGSFEYG